MLSSSFTTDDTVTKLSENSSANLFKEAILAIIGAFEFAIAFEDDYSFNRLKKGIEAYNDEHKSWGTGATSYVRNNLTGIKEGKTKLDKLINSYNELVDPVKPEQWLSLADHLGYSPPEHLDKFVLALDYINSLSYCQYLFQYKWPAIHAFKWSFVNERGFSSTPISDFVASGQRLERCLIELEGTILLPKLRTRMPLAQESNGTIQPETTNKATGNYEVRTEYASAHHLNGIMQAVVVQLTFTWHDHPIPNGVESILADVKLTQQDGFFSQRSATAYEAIKGGIYNASNGTIFVTLRPEAKSIPASMQMTFASRPDADGLRVGTFSALVSQPRQYDNTPPETVSVSGAMLIRTETALPLDKAKISADPALTYRLANQLLIMPVEQAEEQKLAFTTLQTYVGRYICYYMRLSKSPARFETSQIDLNADGTADLTQTQVDQPPQTFRGSVRVVNNRLWLYFHQLPALGREAIRFVVERYDSNEGVQFRGVFSSQTITEKRLVGGRMLMKKWPDTNVPMSFQSIPYDQLRYDDFSGADDLAYFTEAITDHPNLTDGPVWADVARRLHENSALRTIDRLCQPEADPNQPDQALVTPTPDVPVEPGINPRLLPYPNGRYYYYTFKQEVNRDPFLIERSLLTFHRNGRITFEATENTYEGYAYYLNNTLRLSATNSRQGGFLEAFFELPYDRPNLASTKILYGLSLWRSGVRLQGKAVVLSRIGMVENPKRTEIFQFFDPISRPADFARETKRMRDENSSGEGIISYLRGDLNRFLHTPTGAPTEQFRPRDQQSRVLHYRAACYCGFEIPRASTANQRREFIKAAQQHLRLAFTHGYACQFAELELDPEQASTDLDYVERVYSDRFPTADLAQLADTLERIQEIAREKLQIKKDIQGNGPLDYPELQKLVKLLWNDLFTTPPAANLPV